jgi:hypothetical protein
MHFVGRGTCLSSARDIVLASARKEGLALGETIVGVVPLSHHSRFNALDVVVSMVTTRGTYLLAQVGRVEQKSFDEDV